jgi:hypothetical protein
MDERALEDCLHVCRELISCNVERNGKRDLPRREKLLYIIQAAMCGTAVQTCQPNLRNGLLEIQPFIKSSHYDLKYKKIPGQVLLFFFTVENLFRTLNLCTPSKAEDCAMV